jgi:mRNA export factor
MSTLFGSTATPTTTQGDLGKDLAVKDPPADSVSEINFSPKADFLAVASWDNKVRIYEIDGSGNSQGKAMIDFEGPALGVSWSDVRA